MKRLVSRCGVDSRHEADLPHNGASKSATYTLLPYTSISVLL